jgi:hypothetical protein
MRRREYFLIYFLQENEYLLFRSSNGPWRLFLVEQQDIKLSGSKAAKEETISWPGNCGTGSKSRVFSSNGQQYSAGTFYESTQMTFSSELFKR